MAHLFDIRGKQGIQQGIPIPGVAFKEEFRRQGRIRPGIAVHNDTGEVRQGQQRHMVRFPEQVQHFPGPAFRPDALHRDTQVRGRGLGRLRSLRLQVQALDQL